MKPILARYPLTKYLLSGGLLLLSISSAGNALYLSGKALLAQQLLTMAWNKTANSGINTKPWPWADVNAIAKLDIPRLEKSSIVLGGHSGEALAFGPGMVERGDSFIIAGHRDSHFHFLKDLRVNDEITLHLANGNTRLVKVRETVIVNVEDYPDVVAPENSVVLITCYPFDAIRAGGPLRLLITAY